MEVPLYYFSPDDVPKGCFHLGLSLVYIYTNNFYWPEL